MKKIISKLMMTFLIILYPLSVHSGSHSLTKLEQGKIDLVISLDWKPTDLDKRQLKQVFNLFAKDVWRMTEGRHQLRNLYIYTPNHIGKARFWNHADIQFKKMNDVANAQISGFQIPGRKIYIEDDLSDLNEIGHALAHELGHYLYGLYDEYADADGIGGSSPAPNDTAKETLMAQHRQFQRLSLDSDYTIRTGLSTAHYRMYGMSAWKTLITDPKYDPFVSLKSSYLGVKPKRQYFEEFIGLESPSQLNEPTDNPPVNIIYMGGAELSIIIDNSGSMETEKMETAKAGAKSYLDLMINEEDYISTIRFDNTVSVLQDLVLASDETKFEAKVLINQLSSAGGTAIGDGLRRAYELLNRSNRHDTYKYIVLLTDGQSNEGESPTGMILDDLRNANISVYPIGLGEGANMEVLHTIARETYGKAYYSATNSNLASIYSDIQSVTSNDQLGDRVTSKLSLNKPNFEVQAIVDSTVDKLMLRASYSTVDEFIFQLESPDGEMIDFTNLDQFPNVKVINEDGYTYFLVDSPMIGEWRFQVTDPEPIEDGREITLESKTDTLYFINTQYIGGDYPSLIVVEATISKDGFIAHLDVNAEFTDAEGFSFTKTLHDDGIPPDLTADDGIYGCVVEDYPNGNLQVKVQASNLGLNGTETFKAFNFEIDSFIQDRPIYDQFFISDTFTIYTSGVNDLQDDHPNDIENALELMIDALPVSGRVNHLDDRDFFYFNVQSGKEYTVYTTDIYPVEFETKLSVYTVNGVITSEVEKNGASYDGYLSKFIITSQLDGIVHFSVTSTNEQTGSYRIGVRESTTTDYINAIVVNGESLEQFNQLVNRNHSEEEGCTQAQSTINDLDLMIIFIGLLIINLRRRMSIRTNLSR